MATGEEWTFFDQLTHQHADTRFSRPSTYHHYLQQVKEGINLREAERSLVNARYLPHLTAGSYTPPLACTSPKMCLRECSCTNGLA